MAMDRLSNPLGYSREDTELPPDALFVFLKWIIIGMMVDNTPCDFSARYFIFFFCLLLSMSSDYVEMQQPVITCMISIIV